MIAVLKSVCTLHVSYATCMCNAMLSADRRRRIYRYSVYLGGRYLDLSLYINYIYILYILGGWFWR